MNSHCLGIAKKKQGREDHSQAYPRVEPLCQWGLKTVLAFTARCGLDPIYPEEET